MISNIGQNDRTRQSFEPVVYLAYAQQPQANMFLFARSRNADAITAAALRGADRIGCSLALLDSIA